MYAVFRMGLLRRMGHIRILSVFYFTMGVSTRSLYEMPV